MGLGAPVGWDWSVERRVLAELGAELDTPESLEDDIAAALSSADVVMSHHTVNISAGAIRDASRLRAIVVCGTGFDHVDVGAATGAGIAVSNVPDYCIEEVSDHVLALLLALNRRLPTLSTLAQDGRWDDLHGYQLHRLKGQVLGLFGFGRVAHRVAAKAAPLGVRMIAFDPYVSRDEIAAAGVEPAGALESMLEVSDYVSLHAQLTDKTRRIFGTEAFAHMKPGAVLVNCSRGELVDESALCDALEGRHLGGAALDVFQDEPPDAAHPLLGFDNVIVTPHAAWWSMEAEEELHRKSVHAVVEILAGRLPPHVVNDGSHTVSWLGQSIVRGPA